MITKLKIDDEFLVIGNVYAPNQDDADFFIEFIRHIEECRQGEDCCTIIGGDFNLVMDPVKDRLNSMVNHTESHSVLTEYLAKTDLCDIWRCQHPDARLFTWCRQGKQGNLASRIDMFFVPQEWADCVESTNITYGIQSDHSLIDLCLTTKSYERGPVCLEIKQPNP